jgi:hypothetical protein
MKRERDARAPFLMNEPDFRDQGNDGFLFIRAG